MEQVENLFKSIFKKTLFSILRVLKQTHTEKNGDIASTVHSLVLSGPLNIHKLIYMDVYKKQNLKDYLSS